MNKTIIAAIVGSLLLGAQINSTLAQDSIKLTTMGSFAFGGTVTQLSDGTTFHGDHGYAQYYIAENSRHLPIVMWHGIGQSGKTYESTPDGREGFQALLPREDWSVYIVDQPRRGRAGYTLAEREESNVTNSVKMIHKERSKIDPPFYKTGGSFDNQGDFCGYFSFVSTRKIYKSNST